MGWYLWTLDVRKQGLVGGEKNALLDLAVRGRVTAASMVAVRSCTGAWPAVR